MNMILSCLLPVGRLYICELPYMLPYFVETIICQNASPHHVLVCIAVLRPSPSLPALSFSLCTCATPTCVFRRNRQCSSACVTQWCNQPSAATCNPTSCTVAACLLATLTAYCSFSLYASDSEPPVQWALDWISDRGSLQLHQCSSTLTPCHFWSRLWPEVHLCCSGASLLMANMWFVLCAMQGFDWSRRLIQWSMDGANSVHLRALWCETEDRRSVSLPWRFVGNSFVLYIYLMFYLNMMFFLNYLQGKERNSPI